ncbi:putative ion transporter superfamily protein YfcC [Tamaricihabitans halophyticus]|uniref:Putative ion transporter superfamily protein YfcC n=1 Tax=Tamaricihabitans halophyticus TaxID=1262583 RepID=A0A4R2QFE9_9PSEU|nr:Na+/H+ antiporter NhaC family protein [Tamaricihabitans halophyticus]TCP47862.1 putative ion transporter superfamily protein YfcC [Tamaricihabitans halophyticus]
MSTNQPAPSSDKEQPVGEVAGTVTPLRRGVQTAIAVAGLVLSAVLGPLTSSPTLWGFLPLALYAVLLLADLDIVLATTVGLLSGLLVLGAGPIDAADYLADSLASDVVVIGLVIVLGSGLGEVLMKTGAATDLVRLIVQRMGIDSALRAQLGIMLATGVLVIALGTLIGAFALAAPLVIPIAARLGFTRSGTALMMFIGGTCGMFVAPFVGSMVAIRSSSGISYPEFVLVAGGPLAIACFVVGFFLVRWNLRRPTSPEDFYGADDQVDEALEVPRYARQSTVAFLGSFVLMVVYAVLTGAGTSFAVLALIGMAVVAGAAGRLSPTALLRALYDGCGRLFNFFLLFWLLAALFAVIEELNPYEILLDLWGSNLVALGTFTFLVLVGLIGWIGIQGASAAQVLLVDQIFGPTADALGVPIAAWSVVLLASAQADTYGPFPGVNMIAPVGLARSTALKRVLYSSWVLLLVSLAVYTIEIAILH